MNCYFWLASFSTAVPAAARSLFMMTAVGAATRSATVVVAVVVVVSSVVAFVFSAERAEEVSEKCKCREGELKQFCGLAFVKVVVVVAVSLVVINEADKGPQAKRGREICKGRAWKREKGAAAADGHSSFALIRHPSLGWSSTMINCPSRFPLWLNRPISPPTVRLLRVRFTFYAVIRCVC